MPESTLDTLKKYLDAETQSGSPAPLPADFYVSVATYAQVLRRSLSAASSELANRLVSKQLEMLRSMVRELMQLRASKALSQKSFSQLLPEERYVCSMGREYASQLAGFIDGVASGQPSTVELARRNELGRSTTVRFLKHVDELVGLDLKKYGPFEPEDLALIPAANADLLVTNGEAVEIRPRPAP